MTHVQSYDAREQVWCVIEVKSGAIVLESKTKLPQVEEVEPLEVETYHPVMSDPLGDFR